jgi:hypothetical protein
MVDDSVFQFWAAAYFSAIESCETARRPAGALAA